MPQIGWLEILAIVIIAILVLGPKEFPIALKKIGENKLAKEMISYTHQWRDDEGAYWMGRQYERGVFWPKERPSWTSAAAILAADTILDFSKASDLFKRNQSNLY